MGKAHQAPESRYTFARYVAQHAVLRLRERLKVAGLDHLHDDAVSRMLDNAVSQAHGDDYRVQRIEDRGEPSKVVNLRGLIERLNEDEVVYALVKPNDERKPAEAIVTVFDEEMVQNKYKTGHWVKEGDKPKSKGFTNPALQSLASVQLPDQPPAGEKPFIPTADQTRPNHEYVVRRGDEFTPFTSKQAAQAFLVHEFQESEDPDVDLYKRVPISTRRVVVVDIPD